MSVRTRLMHTVSKPDRPDKARAKRMPVRVTRCHSSKDSTNLMTVKRAASEGSLHTAEETPRPTEGRKNFPHRSCRLERAHLERPICNHTKGLHVEKRNMQPCIHSLSKKAKIVGCTCQIVGSHLVRNLDWGASISSDGAIKVLPVFFSKIKEQTNTKKSNFVQLSSQMTTCSQN